MLVYKIKKVLKSNTKITTTRKRTWNYDLLSNKLLDSCNKRRLFESTWNINSVFYWTYSSLFQVRIAIVQNQWWHSYAEDVTFQV